MTINFAARVRRSRVVELPSWITIYSS